jgi:hypothetical protein
MEMIDRLVRRKMNEETIQNEVLKKADAMTTVSGLTVA